MGFTAFMLTLGFGYTGYKLVDAILKRTAYKNKDYAILAVSLCIWLYYIY